MGRAHVRAMTPSVRAPAHDRPEVLAPAGDWDSLRAALASGADAIYFGLDAGFNARARAKNFELADLDPIARACRRAGARAYLTLNTLIFEEELPVLEELLRAVARSGVDALIVQDPATALLAKALCPALELHASTQMTISSPEAARFATRLGVTRVVLPRELSVEQIGLFAAATAASDDTTRPLELEVFVHGALCMSWSGQCLTSEAWGGRSANRGQCAQSCRLPYDLVVDGQVRPLGEVRYLLSPRDLAGHDAVPALIDHGVHTFKIEGRLKGPAYVHTSVASFRRWIDAVIDGRRDDPAARAELARDLSEAHRVYSRGFSSGFFFGSDHQTLVDGRFPKHRGALLGTVVAVHGERVTVERVVEPGPGPAEAPPEPFPGMGVGFDGGDPEQKEPGGPIYSVEPTATGWVLSFGRRRPDGGGPDLSRVAPGQRVWATGDPRAEQRAARLADAEGRVPATMTVSGRLGAPLRATVTTPFGVVGDETDALLVAATGAGLSRALLTDKLATFGGTPFKLAALEVDLGDADLFVPPGAMKALRRRLLAELESQIDRGPTRAVADGPVINTVRAQLAAAAPDERLAARVGTPTIVPLCRSEAQLEAAIAAGCREVELDFRELVGLGRAVDRARAAGLMVTLVTTRVQKPGEEGIDKRLRRLRPDGLLVRHWGGLVTFAEGFRLEPDEHLPVVHGDFSLNVTNSLTGRLLLGLGLETVTASHDLDEAQLFGLLAAMPRGRVGVVVHHHIPTFHTEHCVYAHTLSDGRDYKTCGRPCERHEIALVPTLGAGANAALRHPVITDVNCRNTVFEARAQSAAALVPRLVAAGVQRLRVELVRESAAETTAVLSAYRRLVAGDIGPKAAVAEVGAHEQFGVVRGVAASAR